jgi:hypothetical protein
MNNQTLSEARDALVAAGISGPHQSHSRRNAVTKIKAMLDSDVEARFGLSGLTTYSAAEILSFMAGLTGCSDDIDDLSGYDTIAPDKTVQAIVAAAMRLLEEASRGSTLLCCTGHPTGMLEHHVRVLDAYRRAGGKVAILREREQLPGLSRRGELTYVGGVGVLSDGARLLHTHSSEAMEALLELEDYPELVLGDHGFAGASIERGIPTVAVMDINDPALSVPWAENRDVVVIPMDDNRPPRLYEPSWRIFETVLAGGATEQDAEPPL